MVRIVECPRDAWQGLPRLIPAATKANYLRLLRQAGFTHIDAVSFVSPAAVPQMADSERVLELLGSLGSLGSPESALSKPVEIIGIVVNAKGAERAVKTGRVSTLGFPYSISPGFLRRNQNQTPEDSLAALQAVERIGTAHGLSLVAYVSMAFGNPYGDAWSVQDVREACDRLIGCGVRHISLADTVGLASPRQVADVVGDLMAVGGPAELGVHLHSTMDGAAALVRAAYGAGCRRFDAAIGGLGGCPFAQDALVGNLPTEVLLRTLGELGAELPGLGRLDGLIAASIELAQRFGTSA